MGLIILFSVLLLPVEDCFKVMYRFLKITLSAGYVILH